MKYEKTKSILATIGSHCPGSVIHLLNGVLNYVHIGWWFKQKHYDIPITCADRKSLYQHVAGLVTEPVSYLEFGVFRGASMGIWSGLLKNPDSLLSGFDSFEGLPEVWRMAADEKTFDVKGLLPDIEDSRISFHKGWFEDTLPGFLESFSAKEQLILHLDADLYSSTVYVMSKMEPYMLPGTILIFDELFDREHELKALDEFLEKHPIKLECVGATQGLTQAAFRILSRA
jgi:O-methyltransferase